MSINTLLSPKHCKIRQLSISSLNMDGMDLTDYVSNYFPLLHSHVHYFGRLIFAVLVSDHPLIYSKSSYIMRPQDVMVSTLTAFSLQHY